MSTEKPSQESPTTIPSPFLERGVKWAIVPIPETKVMREVFFEQFSAKEAFSQSFSRSYRHMLAYAPKPEPIGWAVKGSLGWDFTAHESMKTIWLHSGMDVKAIYAL